MKDNEYNEMTLVLNILVEHGTHLESKCSAAEQQLQEQREKQEQQNVEHLNQVSNRYLTMWDLLYTVYPLNTK